MAERVEGQKAKSANFVKKLEQQQISVDRIMKSQKNKLVDEYGKIYEAKDHHGPWRKASIHLQNKFWIEMPMTFVSIFCLFFIPVFQYCRELAEKDAAEGPDVLHDEVDPQRLLKTLVWLTFLINLLYGVEISLKSYALGLRRAFSQSSWTLKLEYFFQPTIWILWIIFLVQGSLSQSHTIEVDFFELIILFRSLRVTSLLNEVDLWRNFIRTITALVKPFFNFAITLYSLFMIYASLGLEMFGGKMSKSELTLLIEKDTTNTI